MIKSAASLRSKVQALVNLEMSKNRPFKPVIVSDIDGVLVRGPNPIPGTLDAIQKIHRLGIPFACLTNGGGRTEQAKADSLNKYFSKKLFDGKSMFLNHTPLKPELLRWSKEKGNLLISGCANIKSVMESLGIRNFITADQLYTVYFDYPDHKYQDLTFHKQHLTRQSAKSEAQQRLGRPLLNFQHQSSNISSIFSLNDISPYETTLSVIHNILKLKKQQGIKMTYYAAQNDIIWASEYPKPRMAFGPFNYILEEHCHRHQLDFIQFVYYGKPQVKAFGFVEKEMRNRQPDGVFFMMGDNPRADIRGANNIGWYSFLTQTGIHSGSNNDPSDPATFVVQNFHQAVQIITQAATHLPN